MEADLRVVKGNKESTAGPLWDAPGGAGFPIARKLFRDRVERPRRPLWIEMEIAARREPRLRVLQRVVPDSADRVPESTGFLLPVYSGAATREPRPEPPGKPRTKSGGQKPPEIGTTASKIPSAQLAPDTAQGLSPHPPHAQISASLCQSNHQEKDSRARLSHVYFTTSSIVESPSKILRSPS